MKVDLAAYRGRRVAVLGATGMIGRAACRRLEELGAAVGKISRSLGCDARDRSLLMERLAGYDLCVGLAGWNGGIQSNAVRPHHIYANNAQIALNAVEACALGGVEFLGVLASCGYPDNPEGVMREADYLAGRPHESVACHGLAKRVMLEACRFASREFPGGKFRCVCVPTVFGPDDHFEDGRTKVVGAMVKRFCDAVARGSAREVCWGTGKPLRDLIYVKDAVELILASAVADWDGGDPLNLSVGQEHSVKKIAETVAKAAGYRGEIAWDESRPDGQYRKKLDASRAAAVFGSFRPTPFGRAVAETAAGYRRRFLGAAA